MKRAAVKSNKKEEWITRNGAAYGRGQNLSQDDEGFVLDRHYLPLLTTTIANSFLFI